MGLITRDRSGFDLPASVPGPAFCRFFFFSSRRRHTRSLCDWSSDVCSSDLGVLATILSVLAANYFLTEQLRIFHITNINDVTAAILFMVVGTIISGLSEAVHRAQRRALDRKSVV